ncbi:hypothetical protein CYMTET_55703 [Cymbomonas tetramitiformis]|uniref:Uncharacterized protein n=1 Tax=Cymbomonas tetramitiformis TaxID=36881 RepID=A0AAE0BE49_9CHLO|nr:hypothetical protein CYMTET_55703 [Cymbomonas tetramitiformis]
MDYAFAYGEELAKLLRSHGFMGLSLDGPDSETDFAVLLANMSHVFGPISRDEVFKLLDLDFDYDVYHYTLNEPNYVVMPTVHRGMALSLYEERKFIPPEGTWKKQVNGGRYLDAAPPPDAAALSVRFPVEPPPHRDIGRLYEVPTLASEDDRGVPAAFSIVPHEDEDFIDWPAFRETTWIPSPNPPASSSK